MQKQTLSQYEVILLHSTTKKPFNAIGSKKQLDNQFKKLYKSDLGLFDYVSEQDEKDIERLETSTIEIKNDSYSLTLIGGTKYENLKAKQESLKVKPSSVEVKQPFLSIKKGDVVSYSFIDDKDQVQTSKGKIVKYSSNLEIFILDDYEGVEIPTKASPVFLENTVKIAKTQVLSVEN